MSGEYNVERFFVAGLLHDIGRLVLCIRVPDETAEVFKKAEASEKPLYVEEQAAFGFDHAELGGQLLKAWKLPERLVEAVSFHHFPEKAINHPEETAVVNLADAIAYSLKLGASGEAIAPPMESKSWESIGLPESLYLPMIKDKIDLQFDDVAHVFLQAA